MRTSACAPPRQPYLLARSSRFCRESGLRSLTGWIGGLAEGGDANTKSCYQKLCFMSKGISEFRIFITGFVVGLPPHVLDPHYALSDDHGQSAWRESAQVRIPGPEFLGLPLAWWNSPHWERKESAWVSAPTCPILTLRTRRTLETERWRMSHVRRWAVPFVPMPKPKPVCRTSLNSKWVQYEACVTFLGRGIRIMNITAQQLPQVGQQQATMLAAPLVPTRDWC